MPMVTGYFGTMTDAYVRALQKKAKLRVSGIVGKKTWKKVGKVKFVQGDSVRRERLHASSRLQLQ